MTTLIIKIDLDNDAFTDEWQSQNEEVARILLSYVARLTGGEPFHCSLRDINGNTVGTALLQAQFDAAPESA